MIKDPMGIIFIVIGLIFLIKPVISWLIKLQNNLRGTQTNITSITIWYYRIVGALLIVVGCFMFFGKK